MYGYLDLITDIIFCAVVIGGMVYALRGAYKEDKREIFKVIAYFLVGMAAIKGFPI